MDLLGDLLSSKVRASLLTVLFDGNERHYYNRELERVTAFPESSIRKELKKLTSLNLVRRRENNSRCYYSADTNHPLYHDLCNIVSKTRGVEALLREALMDDRIELAFIHGSIASGTQEPQSDVDLVVVGNLGLRAVMGLLSKATDKISREINPMVYSVAEFRSKLQGNDHFLTTVIAKPKIFLMGTEDDLTAMG